MKLKILLASTIILLTSLGLSVVLQAQMSTQVRDEILQSRDCQLCMGNGINLSGLNLEGVNFWSSSLREANFSNSNLRGANFNDADLTGANLRGANLTGANLKRANLSHADLTNAQLTNTDLQEAILFEANLKGADLQGANTTGAVMPNNNTIQIPNDSTLDKQPQRKSDFPVPDLNTTAKEITVYVDSISPGSGVIISKVGNTYYVLTAAHVICDQEISYCAKKDDWVTVVTYDGKKYSIDLNKAKKLPGVDLAVLVFTSNENYRVARFANSDSLSGINPTSVYVSGYLSLNNSSESIPTYQLLSGQISDNSPGDMADGYSLFYTNPTLAGMSGGAVLDIAGRVVAIHGRGFTEEIYDDQGKQVLLAKLEQSLGIPINTFLQLAPRTKIHLPVQVETTQPPQTNTSELPQTIRSEINNPNTKTAQASILSNSGFDLLMSGQLEQALIKFEQAIHIEPNFYHAWFGKGSTLQALNRHEEALCAFDKALDAFSQASKIKPNLSYTLFYYTLLAKGSLLRNLRRYDEAIFSSNKIIEDKQGNQEVYRFFAVKAYILRGASRYDLGDTQGSLDGNNLTNSPIN